MKTKTPFPAIKTMAGWDWNWPAKINRMQFEHLPELDFIDTCTNVIFCGPTGVWSASPPSERDRLIKSSNPGYLRRNAVDTLVERLQFKTTLSN